MRVEGKRKSIRTKFSKTRILLYLFKGADEDAMNAIKDLGIEGVDYEKTSKRVYPCGATASQIIGVLNSDGDAITGLELYYDDILGGTAGQKTLEYSKEGVPVPGTEQVTAEVINGQDIVLSIDIDVQQNLRKHSHYVLKRYKVLVDQRCLWTLLQGKSMHALLRLPLT